MAATSSDISLVTSISPDLLISYRYTKLAFLLGSILPQELPWASILLRLYLEYTNPCADACRNHANALT